MRTSIRQGRPAPRAVAAPDASSERRTVLLEKAARLFGRHGFDRTSMRDIAAEFGVLPGSLYHHFGSKEELFLELYTAGVDRMIEAVQEAVQGLEEPWQRLEAACVAHLEQLLGQENVMAGVLANWSTTDEALRKAVVRQRDRYERFLDRLVDAVQLAPGTERRYFRLALLGALNGALTWYRAGRESPAGVARNLMKIFRAAAAPSGAVRAQPLRASPPARRRVA